MSDRAVDLVVQALALAAWLAAPALAGALIAGALTGVLQRVLAWSDPTVGQVARVLAVGGAWALSAPWIAHEVNSFARLAWGGG